MIKALIIDDETQARILLSTLISENCPDVLIAEQCNDLPNGIKAIRKHKPDLVFLDIEMPGHSGLEIADFFEENEMKFGIIYTTAYNQYAIQAIKTEAIDYLLKPIDSEELHAAVERFKRKRAAQEQTLKIANSKIAIPSGQSIKFIDPNEIVYLEAENVYTVIHLLSKEKIVVSRILKNFEETLADQTQFVRCHKSYIINVNYIKDYVKSDGGYLLMDDGKQIPITSDKVEDVLKFSKMVKR